MPLSGSEWRDSVAKIRLLGQDNCHEVVGRGESRSGPVVRCWLQSNLPPPCLQQPFKPRPPGHFNKLF